MIIDFCVVSLISLRESSQIIKTGKLILGRSSFLNTEIETCKPILDIILP